jgi:hypothetical protein
MKKSIEICKGTFATTSLLRVFLLVGTDMFICTGKKKRTRLVSSPEGVAACRHVHEHICREQAFVLWLVLQTLRIHFIAALYLIINRFISLDPLLLIFSANESKQALGLYFTNSSLFRSDVCLYFAT